MRLNTDHLRRCIDSLEGWVGELSDPGLEDSLREPLRAASVKYFEMILEQSGRMLRKRLRPWLASNRQADTLTFRDLFRHAAKHGLLTADASERWLEYRDNRNDTAHDYGEDFAEKTLSLLPTFIADAKDLAAAIEAPDDE